MNLRSRRAHALLMASVLVLSGCSGQSNTPEGQGAAPAAEAPHLTGADVLIGESWMGFLAKNAASMARLLQESPDDGWVKLYNQDYPSAQRAFAAATTASGKMGLARSHLADAELFELAYALAIQVELAYQQMLDENAGRLKSSPLDAYVAAVRFARAGKMDEAVKRMQAFRATEAGKKGRMALLALVQESWWTRTGTDPSELEKSWKSAGVYTDPVASLLAAGLKLEGNSTAGLPAELKQPEDEQGKRLWLWAQVQAGQVDAALELARSLNHRAPDVEEQVTLEEGQAARKFTDPLVLKALAVAHAKKAAAVSEGLVGAGVIKAVAARISGGQLDLPASEVPAKVNDESLPVFVFSSHATPADLLSSLNLGKGGLIPAYLEALGPVAAESSEGKDTRLAVTAAQGLLDDAKKVVAASPDAEGKDNVAGLKLLEQAVHTAVRARAAQYEEKGRQLDAIFLLEHTVDKENSRLNYQNEPRLYIRITRAYAAIGRYREALNYLYRLVESRPEFLGIQETLGNLSVLDNVDRSGRTGGQD